MTEAARANPDQSPEEVRERVERYWPGLTAEPGGVDYLEVEVAGLPALWAVPKGSPEDRVILAVHGGGGVSGSIYTHRKLFGHLAKAVGARALLTEYRQAQYPAPHEDTTTAYRWLLDQGVDARHIAVFLSATFTAYGSYASPASSMDGFRAALFLGGAASLIGMIAAAFGPGRRRVAGEATAGPIPTLAETEIS